MASERTDFLDWLAGLSPRTILLHPAFLFLVATIVTIGVAIQLWDTYQDKIVNVDDYRLTEDQITVSPAPPAWVQQDLKQVVLQEFEGQPNLLDTDLVPATARVFQQIGYVQTVEQVQKSESGLQVNLSYRQPIAMVKYSNDQLLPVDRLGVIMDGRIVSPQAAQKNFLKISVMPPHSPNLEMWKLWPDVRVQGAAAIANYLGNDWQSIGIYRIVSFERIDEQNASKPFELWSADANGRIIWGNAPGSEAPGEADAAEKLQALQKFIVQRGPVNRLLGRKKLDVRTGNVVLIENAQTAQEDEWIKSFR